METNLLFTDQSEKKLTATQQNKGLQKLLFRTGLGVDSTPEVPLRLISYIGPLLTAVSRLNKDQKRSVGQIYIADQGMIRTGADAAVVEQNAAAMEVMIQNFINEFFPDIQNQAQVLREKPNLSTEQCRLLDELESILSDYVTTNPESPFTKFIKRTGGSVRYGAEHALYMGDPVTSDRELFLVSSPEDWDYRRLTMIGGRSEKLFQEARKVMQQARLKVLGASSSGEVLGYETDQLEIRAGQNKPPYFKFNETEALPSDFNKDAPDVGTFLNRLPKELLRDYVYTLALCSRPNRDTSTLVADANRKNWDPKNANLEPLSEGWSRLKTFTSNL